MKKSDWPKLSSGISELASLPVWIVDDSGMTLRDLRGFLNAHKRRHGLDVVVLDYLQIVNHQSERGSRERDVAEITSECKRIAKSLGIGVVLLSQLNRKLEERKDKRPGLHDLRDTGQIEQDADKVLFLYRDEYYVENSRDAGITEVIVAKARNGREGVTRMKHNLSRMQYREAR